MKTIYKYALEPTTVLRLPASAELLTVQTQAGAPVLWVLLDQEDLERRIRTVRSFPTGGLVPAEVTRRHYLGTFQTGGLVFHVFETTELEGGPL